MNIRIFSGIKISILSIIKPYMDSLNIYIFFIVLKVMESDGWKQLVKEKYVDLMEQIMKALAEAK
jgi:hypothetical protein